MKSLNGYVWTIRTRKILPDLRLLKLRTTLKTKMKDGSQEVDVLRWMSRTALELIGQSGMGYSFDDLVEEDNTHPYTESMKRFLFVTEYFSPEHVSTLLQYTHWWTFRISYLSVCLSSGCDTPPSSCVSFYPRADFLDKGSRDQGDHWRHA